MFGISSAPEAYQYIIQQSLSGMRNISDDIIVYGKDQAEHDRNLAQVLPQIVGKGLTLNKDKCLFSVPQLTFFGFKVSSAAISPDDQKVSAIKDARRPTNPNKVRSFLGLVNYCARFFPNPVRCVKQILRWKAFQTFYLPLALRKLSLNPHKWII